MITIRGYDHENNALVSSYTANELNQHSQRTVPGYACVRGSATNTATVTVNGNAAWRLGEYFYGGDEADNAASAVMKELDITAVVNPPGTNDADLVQSVTGRVFVAQSPEAFTHDDDGNLLSDGRFTYTWDGENRLLAVETRADLPTSVPRVKVAYSYDHRSRRVGKVVSRRGAEAQSWELAESRSFLYDGWNMIQELTHTQTHTLTNFYTWGLDLSGSLQGAAGVGGLLAVVKDSAAYVPAWDANGNVSEYVSTDGTIAAHYEYSPFGETVIQTGSLADTFGFRFSSKYWENEAKLYYYGYRFYAPGVGRWLNRDPAGENGGVCLFSFCINIPTMYVDTNGRELFPDWAPPGTIWGCKFDSLSDIPGAIYDDVVNYGSDVCDCVCSASEWAWDQTCTAAQFTWELPTRVVTTPLVWIDKMCGADEWALTFCCDNGEEHTVNVLVGGFMSDKWGMTLSSGTICTGRGTMQGYSSLNEALTNIRFRDFMGHECGHAIQAEFLGPLYLPCVAPFTGWSYEIDGFNWAEQWADELGACIRFPEVPNGK